MKKFNSRKVYFHFEFHLLCPKIAQPYLFTWLLNNDLMKFVHIVLIDIFLFASTTYIFTLLNFFYGHGLTAIFWIYMIPGLFQDSGPFHDKLITDKYSLS